MDKQEHIEKKRNRIIQMVYIAMIIALIIVFLKYVFPVIMPFVIAFLIAALCMPIVRFLARKTKLKNKRIWGLIVIFTLYGLIVSLVTWLVFKILGWLTDFITRLPELYLDSILPALERIKEFSTNAFARISPEHVTQYQGVLNDMVKTITTKALSLSGDLASNLTTLSLALPGFFLTVSFALLASIFIVWDYDNIVAFFSRQLPEATRQRFTVVVQSFSKSVKDYVKAYLIIASITCVELAIGFLLIGLPNAIPIALGIAVFDMIPVFGTGGIMVPWIIIAFLNGNTTLGIQLLVIYGVVTLVRNVMEPKIVGQKLGLNTVLALFVMFVGLQVFGIIGMIFAPILTVMVINFKNTEQMNWWK